MEPLFWVTFIGTNVPTPVWRVAKDNDGNFQFLVTDYDDGSFYTVAATMYRLLDRPAYIPAARRATKGLT